MIRKMKASAGETECNLKDLAQDIYIVLMEKPASVILELYDKGELNYYLCGIITNQLVSKTSPYYKTYKIHHEELLGDIDD